MFERFGIHGRFGKQKVLVCTLNGRVVVAEPNEAPKVYVHDSFMSRGVGPRQQLFVVMSLSERYKSVSKCTMPYSSTSVIVALVACASTQRV